MQKHEWRAEPTDIAQQNLGTTLTALEEQGWEIFAVLPRGPEDKFLVVVRRPK